MEYFLKPTALRSLRKFPRNIQKRIIEKLDFYCGAENPLKFAEKLTDKTLGDFRFRVGEYRITFDLENNRIIILFINHRKDIYRK